MATAPLEARAYHGCKRVQYAQCRLSQAAPAYQYARNANTNEPSVTLPTMPALRRYAVRRISNRITTCLFGHLF